MHVESAPLIRNNQALLARGMADLRAVALEVVKAGLAAIDPLLAVERSMQLTGRSLVVGSREYNLECIDRIFVLGAGKASLRIVQGVEALLGDRIAGGVVVVPRGQSAPPLRTEVWEADHPFPSQRSLEGAHRLRAIAEQAGSHDLIISCVTGGSSALVCYPAEGITLAEKHQLHRLLLECGASIEEINAVRQHTSQIKGGRLARYAAPAQIINLTVSDVAGDSAQWLSDLTAQDLSTADDAVQVLRAYRLWEHVAPSIQTHLTGAALAGAPDLSAMDINTIVMVNGEAACTAMADRARELGFGAYSMGSSLEGEGQATGTVLGGLARECSRHGRPFPPRCVVFGCGGETTVTLTRSDEAYGMGGPNQEVALGLALKLESLDQIAAVFIDTDGSDGGTDVAGAVVDGLTRARAMEQGLDLRGALIAHRARQPLEQLGDLVVTGPTLTNVNDLFAIVIGHP